MAFSGGLIFAGRRLHGTNDVNWDGEDGAGRNMDFNPKKGKEKKLFTSGRG